MSKELRWFWTLCPCRECADRRDQPKSEAPIDTGWTNPNRDGDPVVVRLLKDGTEIACPGYSPLHHAMSVKRVNDRALFKELPGRLTVWRCLGGGATFNQVLVEYRGGLGVMSLPPTSTNGGDITLQWPGSGSLLTMNWDTEGVIRVS